jgi:hypothetical protein
VLVEVRGVCNQTSQSVSQTTLSPAARARG